MADKDLIQRYEDARRRYENRIKSWVTKFHAIIKPLPRVKHTKNITEKSIERLEKVIWPKVSKRRKKEAQKEYEIQYENRNPAVYAPKPPYNPPTEADFLNNNIPEIPQSSQHIDETEEDGYRETVVSWDEIDEDGYKQTIDSREELENWLNRVINDVVISLPEKEVLHGVADNIYNYVNQAFWQAEHFQADIQYLQYLEENADRFHDLALKAIHGYESKGNKAYLEQGGETALTQFVTLLNFGRPISPEDSDNYNEASMFGTSFEEMYG